MDQKEVINNEEEKRNTEEEEYDEEDEEDKEEEKVELKNKNNEGNNNDTEKEKTEDKNQDKKDNTVQEQIVEESVEKENVEQNENNPQKIEDNNEDLEQKQKINDVKNEDINNEEDNEIKKVDIDNENKNESDNTIEKKESEDNNQEEEEEEEKEEEEKESTTTYILKYTRKNNEPRESSYDKELIKPKQCLFMIEFKILQGKNEQYLLIFCHEIAAIYFDEIYEKKYSIKDLYKENRHFRIFNEVKEAKNIVDEILKNNTKNTKKIFIDLQDNTFRLHLKMIFFDKETEIIFNIPKKNITDKERIRLLPEFLKEIQIKMNHLEEENKKLKNETKNLNDSELIGSMGKLNADTSGDNDFIGKKNELNSNKKVKSVNEKGYKKKLIKK